MHAICILVCLPLSSAVIHSLQYFYTATSGISSLPEFVAVGMVDGLVISQYDSNTRKCVPRQTWMEENLDQKYWDSETGLDRTDEGALKEDLRIFKGRFNHTEGEHVLQRMFGCEWDDESDRIDGYEQYGYDGEDFITLNLTNMRWVALKPQAVVTKNKWNTIESGLNVRKQYFTQDCPDWLKKYVQYGNSSLRRKVPPEVSLIQNKSSSTVVCLATGFYPATVNITWKRDGEEMHKDVDVGETLPNGDGTYQKRAVITVSPEEREKSQYTCEVTHISGEPTLITLTEQEDVKELTTPGEVRHSSGEPLTTLTEEEDVKELTTPGEVRHSSGEPLTTLTEEDGNTVGIITGCVITALVVIIIGVVIAVVMKKKKIYKNAEQSVTYSDATGTVDIGRPLVTPMAPTGSVAHVSTEQYRGQQTLQEIEPPESNRARLCLSIYPEALC